MTGSYYNPIHGTCNVTIGSTSSPIVSEMRKCIAVACDLGRKVYCINEGKVVWEKDFPESWPRAMTLFDGILYVADGRYILGLSPETGFCHFKNELGNVINSLNFKVEAGKVLLTVCYDKSGSESVELFEVVEGGFTSVFKNPHKAIHPRSAYYTNAWLFVSDTFGHEVYSVDIRDASKTASLPVYYPNSVKMLSNEEVLICAEHENRIIKWDYTTNEIVNLAGCNLYPFNTSNVLYPEILELEKHTEADDSFQPHKSIASIENAGINSLYSPNSAEITPEGILVCDTDNHRVVLIKDNIVVESCSGFNNPVNSVFIE